MSSEANLVLLEQAFHALPEILCGSRYPAQEYEAGVVAALTMAILQELNGRNVPNPLSCIQGERLYEAGGFQSNGRTRYLRADLVVDTRQLMVANKRLGSRYGWRHVNWLEAKFFRARSKLTNKTQTTAALLVDLLRLAMLVPEKAGSDSENGRYLLHVYDQKPSNYISSRRNKTDNHPGGKRPWVAAIHDPGVHSFEIAELDREPSSFLATLGTMGTLSLKLRITNTAVSPLEVPAAAQGGSVPPVYWCVLTRIDSVECAKGDRQFALDSSRVLSEKAVGDFEALREDAALLFGEVPEVETTAPEDPALAPEDVAP